MGSGLPPVLAGPLRRRGLTAKDVATEVLELVGHGGGPVGAHKIAPRLRHSIEVACRRATLSDRFWISCDDLLAGMITEAGGIAVQALDGLGIDVTVLGRQLGLGAFA